MHGSILAPVFAPWSHSVTGGGNQVVAGSATQGAVARVRIDPVLMQVLQRRQRGGELGDEAVVDAVLEGAGSWRNMKVSDRPPSEDRTGACAGRPHRSIHGRGNPPGQGLVRCSSSGKRARLGSGVCGRSGTTGAPARGAQADQAGDGHPAGRGAVRGRASGPGDDGPSEHRAGAGRRGDGERAALFRNGTGA
jgi:hypothetical protein